MKKHLFGGLVSHAAFQFFLASNASNAISGLLICQFCGKKLNGDFFSKDTDSVFNSIFRGLNAMFRFM